MTSEKNISFIDFVVCPSYKMAYKKDVPEYYGLDIENYLTGNSFYPTKHETNIDPRQLFNIITYNVSEIFSQIVVRTLNKEDPKITIDFSNKFFTNRVNIETKYSDLSIDEFY